MKKEYEGIRPFLLSGIVIIGISAITLYILNSPNIALYNIEEASLPIIRLFFYSVFSTGVALISLVLITQFMSPNKPSSSSKKEFIRLTFNALMFSILILIVLTLILENINSFLDKGFIIRNAYLSIILVFPAALIFFLKVGLPSSKRRS